MSRPPRILSLAALLAFLLPATARGWGGATHVYIAQHYSQHLPATIDGLRVYDDVVAQHVNDPDTRKSYTPGEAEKHYIDIDAYPEFFTGRLSHDLGTLEAEYGPATVVARGVLPWAVGDETVALTQQFAAQQWGAAALTIADLCHYVGDATQPLHCTQNYDGQLTGNYGIHSRYESEMMSAHIGDLQTPPRTVTYRASPVDAIFDVIGASWSDVATVLDGDNSARAASGGPYDATYYAALWAATQSVTRERINEATVVTASLVYTAWVDAGRPEVPGSSAPVDSVAPAIARLEAGPTPFHGGIAIHFAGAGPLRLEVFDARGARVARLAENTSGSGSLVWRPADAGRSLGPGLYFVRLTGPGLVLVRRIVFLG
jgi:hypothetical protein